MHEKCVISICMHKTIQSYNVINLSWTWVVLCREIADTLGVPCFSIPPTSSSSSKQKSNGSYRLGNVGVVNGEPLVGGKEEKT